MTNDQMASLFPPKTEDDRIKGELAWVKPGDTLTRFRFPITVYDVVRLASDDARGWELTLEDGNKRLIGDYVNESPDAVAEERSPCVAARKVWFP